MIFGLCCIDAGTIVFYLVRRESRELNWAGDEVGFDFSNANLNPVWAMTASPA